ncbi:DUF4178 domain-containing protein [Jeongeupia naejangsanensis]|uniref:DUF4178 domain-containing protein n=1 Tax=Jeongeupia naejangsanensis TaxID=613195 RepID=A0ABS2BRM5_9NEIS|nr:DUF4178 domain-containing protein [Jeongeupia naejangsanensis]MBM3117454.1 DUF4178 domain-containing protein [Jeongeupia naejangsanensis]
MYRVACPSCGAEVVFRSTISVMAVCEYCRTVVLRDADAVREQGRLANVLEDASPLQIGSSGVWQGRHFALVGRIQLRYDAGFWNEWYALFDDGSAGWLAEAGGQYVFTLAVSDATDIPNFENLRVGAIYRYGGNSYTMSDVRGARCTGGQGELPFVVGDGWEARVADARCRERFLTLDYSDEKPQVYVGTAAPLDTLNMQLLRDDDTIVAAAGRLRGTPQTLTCPSCGSPLEFPSGIATQLVCPACHAEVDCSSDTATLIANRGELARVVTTLAIGDVGTIAGRKWTVIGLLHCREADDVTSVWTEYLLYHPSAGLQWLVEAEEGWDQVRVMDIWPESASMEQAVYKGEHFRHLYDYASVVTFAAGAFNWRAAVGDKTWISDYERNGIKLTRESGAKEMGWSRSERVTAQLVGQWFGKPALANRPRAGLASGAGTTAGDRESLRRPATWAMAIFLLINLPILITSGFDDDVIMVGFVAMILLWIPANQDFDG